MPKLDDPHLNYQAAVCNDILLTTMLKLKSSGLEDSEITVLLDCIGKTLVHCSIANRPINYYIQNITKEMTGEGNGK